MCDLQEQEEDDRLKKFTNLVSQRSEDVDTLMLDCASQFHKLPNTDPTKLLYHNYLYALQRLRDYHALFNEDLQASLQINKPPVSLEFRQGAAAKAFFHDFLQAGSPWALCVPYKLVRNLRSQLMHVGRSHRFEFLFMDIEHVVLTELRIGLEEAKTKVRKQVLNQLSPIKKSSINPLTGLAAKQEALGGSSASAQPPTPAPAPRRSVAMRGSISGGSGGLPGMGNGKLALEVVQEYAAAAAAAPAPPAAATLASFNFSESDVPFNIVFGVSTLFASFKRFSLICRHANPQYLWNQLALVSRIFDLRSISEPKVLALAAKQTYAQFLSDTAPSKVNISKMVLDQCKVGVSTASPGPHVFLGVLRELYNNLQHLYTNSFKTSEAAASLFACMQEDFGLFVRSEICVTQGKREQAFDASISLMSNNKNAATWFDMAELRDIKELDESLVNLSSHQAMWCAYFKQFLTERSDVKQRGETQNASGKERRWLILLFVVVCCYCQFLLRERHLLRRSRRLPSRARSFLSRAQGQATLRALHLGQRAVTGQCAIMGRQRAYDDSCEGRSGGCGHLCQIGRTAHADTTLQRRLWLHRWSQCRRFRSSRRPDCLVPSTVHRGATRDFPADS